MAPILPTHLAHLFRTTLSAGLLQDREEKKQQAGLQRARPFAGVRGVPEKPLFLLLPAAAGGKEDLATALTLSATRIVSNSTKVYNRHGTAQ
jgi:hypothetical protein